METFQCARCRRVKEINTNGAAGYGIVNDEKVCYDCCGEMDEKSLREMIPGQKIMLYWDGKEVTNWPGTLRITPTRTNKYKHNFGGHKTNIWFTFEGHKFYGFQVGEFNQVAHFKKLS